MSSPIYSQYPDERLDYVVDMTQWLGSGTLGADTIVSAAATATVGLTVSCTFNPYTTVVWVSGGMIGQTYIVKSSVTTALGRQKDYLFQVVISDYVIPVLIQRPPFQ